MANTDKNITITPNKGSASQPNMVFTGFDNNPITLTVLDDNTLSFEGSAGQLFSITPSLTGTIFSVNDVSGIPSIEVEDNGLVKFAPFGGNVLVGSTTDNAAAKLQVTGNFTATGEVTAYYSDARLKDFLGTIDSPIEKLNQINGYYFVENELAKSLGLNNDKKQVGVSAQEIEAVLPEATAPAPFNSEYLTVKYEKIVPLLIEAVKAQQIEINELKEEVRTLRDK